MSILVDKALLLRLYCYTFQAERSIGFALGAEWNDLLGYYRGDRLEGVKRLCREMEAFAAGLPRATRLEIGRQARPVSILQFILGKWTTRWQQRWTFSEREIGFLAGTLAALERVLETPERPTAENLISLRMDLCCCRSCIEARCYGLAEIRRARWLEHFWQADWIKPVRLADLVEEQDETEPLSGRAGLR